MGPHSVALFNYCEYLLKLLVDLFEAALGCELLLIKVLCNEVLDHICSELDVISGNFNRITIFFLLGLYIQRVVGPDIDEPHGQRILC